MSDYYYYKENGNLYRFRIERDDDPWDPRKDQDGNIGTMICTERNRNCLGDERVDIEKYISDLIRENIKDVTIINYIKKGKASNNLSLKYNRSEKVWELWGDYYTLISPKVTHGIINDNERLDYLVDDMIDALPIEDQLTLLTRKGYVFLPLAIYDHSGVTMWVGSKWDHFDAQWDCSNVGFIFTTKKKVFEWCGGYRDDKKKFHKLTERNWREVAEHDLKAEVELYDMWLQGECYGYWQEKWNALDGEWEELNSCWGFYSDKWDEELAREMANSDMTTQPFIDEEVAQALADAQHEETKIMAQADTMVCV